MFYTYSMNLGEALSTFFRDLAAALGFIAIIEVSLVAGDVTIAEGTVQVHVRVQEGLTEALRRVIEA